MTTPEDAARKRRNLFIALALAAFVALVFAVTVARLGASVLERPM
jgi:hypothetical protein